MMIMLLCSSCGMALPISASMVWCESSLIIWIELSPRLHGKQHFVGLRVQSRFKEIGQALHWVCPNGAVTAHFKKRLRPQKVVHHQMRCVTKAGAALQAGVELVHKVQIDVVAMHGQ